MTRSRAKIGTVDPRGAASKTGRRNRILAFQRIIEKKAALDGLSRLTPMSKIVLSV